MQPCDAAWRRPPYSTTKDTKTTKGAKLGEADIKSFDGRTAAVLQSPAGHKPNTTSAAPS